jgi:hypothetical protein
MRYTCRRLAIQAYSNYFGKRNNTGRFIIYSGITKIYYRKTLGQVIFSLGICQRPDIRPTIAT